jgi:UDP-2,4-diacetamido-2,4,6-trideoxy-beta-L-altropyranose hydrolase
MGQGAPRVLFLADSGEDIGGGHLLRCLTLAQALAEQGAVCAFAAKPSAIRVLDVFGAGVERLPVADLDPPTLAEETARAADAWGAQAVVVDHYGLDERQQRVLQGQDRRVAVIDDLADRAHDCSLLIDPSLGRAAEDYAGLAPGARVLAGPGYALLRPEYVRARPDALARRRPEDPPRRLLISLGLTDFRGVTGRALNLIDPLLGELEVDVALGSSGASLIWLRRLAERNANVRLHVDTRQMAELIAAADIGLGAGGASSWERAVLGLPSVSLILTSNQDAMAREMERQGAALAVDARAASFARELPAAFERLLGDGALRSQLSRASAALCDGLGAGRAATAILAMLG